MHTLKKCTDNPIPQLPHDTPFSINQTRQRKKNTTDQGGRYTIGKHRHRNTGHRPRTMTAAAHSDIRNPTHKIHINLAAAALERTLLHHHHRHKKTSLIQKHSITRTPRNVLGRMRSDGCAHLQIDRVREEHDRAERAGDREARRNRTDARSGRGALGSIADDDAQSPDRASASLEAGRGEHETLIPTPAPRPRGRGEMGGKRRGRAVSVSRRNREPGDDNCPGLLRCTDTADRPSGFPARARRDGFTFLPRRKATWEPPSGGGQEGNFQPPYRQPATLLLFVHLCSCVPTPPPAQKKPMGPQPEPE